MTVGFRDFVGFEGWISASGGLRQGRRLERWWNRKRWCSCEVGRWLNHKVLTLLAEGEGRVKRNSEICRNFVNILPHVSATGNLIHL